uniref:Reverse transcriptase domain-containing protein n=1 Tax=Strongyloides venezuelensis TaxID=75913 RepID=A0A0K0F4S5_STRVS
MILSSNVPLTFTLDCGARYNYISSDVLSTLKIKFPPPTDMFVVGFNGLPVKIESIINLNLTINEIITTAFIPKSTYISRDILPDVIDHVEEQVSEGNLSEVSAPKVYSSVTIVKKPDGNIRICLSATNINEHIVKIPNALDNVHTLLYNANIN